MAIVDRTEITLERIKKLCEDHGYSLSGLEKKLGYGNTSLSKAKNISSGRIAEIADFFDVSADYLVGRSDDPYHHRRPKRVIDVTELSDMISTAIEREHPELFQDDEVEIIKQQLTPEEQEQTDKAIALYKKFQSAPPEVRAAIETLLKASSQSES